jgi:transposase
MKNLNYFDRILFYKGQIDFRKRRKSLAAIVQNVLNEDPFSKTFFLFLNKSKTCVRALYWNGSGFAMWELELEQEKFPLPRKMERLGVLELTVEQLEWFLSGIDFWNMKHHKKLEYSLV